MGSMGVKASADGPFARRALAGASPPGTPRASAAPARFALPTGTGWRDPSVFFRCFPAEGVIVDTVDSRLDRRWPCAGDRPASRAGLAAGLLGSGTSAWRPLAVPPAVRRPLAGRGLAQPGETWQQSSVPGNRERRRPGHFRICPACGKRNKTRRAECSRCGEPLRGLPEAIPGTLQSPPPPPRKYRWLIAAVVVVAIGAGLAVQRTFRSSMPVSAVPTTTADATPIPSAEPVARPTLDPTSAERYARVKGSVERGQRLLAKGDFRGAASLLADAARLVPEEPRIANAYGHALLGLGSRGPARSTSRAAARLEPGWRRKDRHARALAEPAAKRERPGVRASPPSIPQPRAYEGLLHPGEPAPAAASPESTRRASAGARPRPRAEGHDEDLAAACARCAHPRPCHRRPRARPRRLLRPTPGRSPHPRPTSPPTPAAAAPARAGRASPSARRAR